MTRITEEMGVVEGLTVMCDGNPGAMQVVAALANNSRLSDVVLMDALGIYGERIWMLYKDECGENLDALRLALRIRQRQTASQS